MNNYRINITLLLSFIIFNYTEAQAKNIKPYLQTTSINNKTTNISKQADYDYLFANITKEYGVKVYYKDDNNYFPKEWKVKTIDPKLITISDKELKRFPKIIEEQLKKYSKSTIKKYLKGIYLSKDITFYNVSFGATYFTDRIYLTSKGVEKYYTDIYLANLFNHELSSILLLKNKFPQAEWESWNSKDFVYGSGGVQALKENKTSLYGNKELYSGGILSEYSLSAFEEDFNVYSGMIFAQPGEFYKLMKEYPSIREKFNIWLKYYNSIDKKITLEYLFKDQLSQKTES